MRVDFLYKLVHANSEYHGNARGSRKGNDAGTQCRDPGNAELRDGDSLIFGNRVQGIDDGEIVLHIFVFEAAVAETDVAL